MKPASPAIGLPLDRVGLGMGLALAAYSLLAAQDATVKWLVTTVPVWQVLFFRSAVLVVGCLVCGGRPLLRHVATTPSLPLLGLRGAVTLTAWSCYFTAARSLPLGQLTTLWFTAPIIVTLLAIPLLGERVSRARWTAVGLGFIGAILAANPGDMTLSAPAALVLVAAGLWGFGVIITRWIARRERSIVQMLANNIFFLVVTGIGGLLEMHWPTMDETLLLMQVAILGGIGQFCLFECARHAPVSVTAPIEYTALIWAFVFGALIWGDMGRPSVFAGATFICAAGLVLVMAERSLKGQR